MVKCVGVIFIAAVELSSVTTSHVSGPHLGWVQCRLRTANLPFPTTLGPIVGSQCMVFPKSNKLAKLAVTGCGVVAVKQTSPHSQLLDRPRELVRIQVCLYIYI